MNELLINLNTKLKVENFKTLYIVTINEEGKNKNILRKAFTSAGACKSVMKEYSTALLVRVKLATED